MMIQLFIDWDDFYSKIRANSWPDCTGFDQIKNLPEWIQHEIYCIHLPNAVQIDSSPRNIKILASTAEEIDNLCQHSEENFFVENNVSNEPFKILNKHGIDIYYAKSQMGGGEQRLEYFNQALQELFPTRIFNNCLEWCAGPGPIGFSLLGNNTCHNLVLAEIYKPSIESCKKTIANLDKKYLDKVKVHHLKDISSLPNSYKFDLIVGNPPFRGGKLITKDASFARRGADPGFKIHKRFFDSVKNYLTPDGIIILDEGSQFSGPADFKSMIEDNGLIISKVFEFTDNGFDYFMVIEHAK